MFLSYKMVEDRRGMLQRQGLLQIRKLLQRFVRTDHLVVELECHIRSVRHLERLCEA